MYRIVIILFFTLVPAMSIAADYSFGTPIKEANLTLIPVYPAKSITDQVDDYLTFAEANDKKLIEVTELNGNTSDAQVSAVHVTSKAQEPIILLAGEVILGGKQDRVISTNTIVEPGTKKLEVPVFCVEQGRWDNSAAEFRASKEVAHGKLRSTAIFAENQQEVWAEVREQNKRSMVAPSTGTYRATLDSAEVAKRVDKMTKSVLPRVAGDKRAVGLVAAVDGELSTFDAFANPKLFQRVRDQLVKSYILAAVTSENPDERDVSADTIASLNERIADDAGSKRRAKGSGEADNVYYDKGDRKKSVTRSKDGKKVHEYVDF